MFQSKKLRDMAAELRDEFEQVSEELDMITKNVNIARVTGGTVGVVGGVVATIGFIAIPFTAGLSALVAGVAGGVVGAAGGLTAGGAQITQMIIEKIKLQDVSKKWSFFCENVLKELEKDPEEFQDVIKGFQTNMARMGMIGVEVSKDVAAILAGGGAAARAAETTVVAGTAAVRAAAAGSTATRLSAATAAGSVGLNVILVGFSIFDIMDGSIELHKQKKSKAGDSLRKLALSLDVFAKTGSWHS